MSDSFSFVFYNMFFTVHIEFYNCYLETIVGIQKLQIKCRETSCVNDPDYDKGNNLHNGNPLFKTK